MSLQLNAIDDTFYAKSSQRDNHDQLEKDLFLKAKCYDMSNLEIPLFIEGFLRDGFNLTIQMNQNGNQMIPPIISYLVCSYIKSMREWNTEHATKANFMFICAEPVIERCQSDISDLE
eukprot:307301_1